MPDARPEPSPLPGSKDPSEGWTGRRTVAVILQTEDRDDDRSSRALKLRLERNTRVRGAIAGAGQHVEAGNLDAARAAIQALSGTDLPRVSWSETPAELATGLADCLDHGEQCYEHGPIECAAGRVIWMSVWYDPSHPVYTEPSSAFRNGAVDHNWRKRHRCPG